MKTKLDKKLYLKLHNYYKSYEQNKTKIKNMYKYIFAKMAKYDYKLEIKNKDLKFVLKPQNIKIEFIFTFIEDDQMFYVKNIKTNNIIKSVKYDDFYDNDKCYINKISKNICVSGLIDENNSKEINLSILKNNLSINYTYILTKKQKYINIEILKTRVILGLTYIFKNYLFNNKIYFIKIKYYNEGVKPNIFYKYISCFNIFQSYRFNNFIDLI